jgi:16S rRNA (guanine527-N7)-methyltransferase
METLALDEQTWKRRLAEGAAELVVQLDEAQVDLLWRYGHMMRERNEHVNLTSIVSPEGILTLHMLDSLTVARHLGDARTILDVGTGGGFPGVPLAVAFPERQFTLIDGTQKKIRFVSESLEQLDIRNALALASRAELMPRDQLFDVVIMRAVSTLAEFIHNAGHLITPTGRLLAMKGRLPEDEINAVPRGWRGEVEKLQVPGVETERHLVSLSRVIRTPGPEKNKEKPAER